MGVPSESRWRALTNLSRKVFSLRAPMQPAKPSTDMMPPTTTNSHTQGQGLPDLSVPRCWRENAQQGEQRQVGTGHPTISAHSSPAPHPAALPSHSRPRDRWPEQGPQPARTAAKSLEGTSMLSHPSRGPSLLVLMLFRKPQERQKESESTANGSRVFSICRRLHLSVSSPHRAQLGTLNPPQP